MSSRGHSLKLRRLAFQRNSGVCVSCGADCEKIKRVYWAILDFEARSFYADILGVYDEGRTFWDADHVVELTAGGTDNADNIQTLCVACHKTKTVQFAVGRSGFGGRPRAGKPLILRPVRLDDDVWAAVQGMKSEYPTINEGFRAVLFADRAVSEGDYK